MLPPIGSGERILEQWNLWCCESKHHEQHAYQADRGESKPWVFALQPAYFECPPSKQIDQQCQDIENGNVDPVQRLAKHSVIGVEQRRDQHKAQKNLHQLDTPVFELCILQLFKVDNPRYFTNTLEESFVIPLSL